MDFDRSGLKDLLVMHEPPLIRHVRIQSLLRSHLIRGDITSQPLRQKPATLEIITPVKGLIVLYNMQESELSPPSKHS